MIIAYRALLGGALIGCSATLLLACNGRIAGISGIVNGIYGPSAFERAWRLSFLGGLVGAAAFAFQVYPENRPHRIAFPIGMLILAGFLVGFGTRMGNGCTSGHGVCGLGRLSRRSLIAVIAFMSIAIVTVAVTRHVMALLPP